MLCLDMLSHIYKGIKDGDETRADHLTGVPT